jgi:hypothetical protein
MVKGGHGLPKVLLRPAMPYPSTPSGRATLETALQCLMVQSSSTHLDTPCRTPMQRANLRNFPSRVRLRHHVAAAVVTLAAMAAVATLAATAAVATLAAMAFLATSIAAESVATLAAAAGLATLITVASQQWQLQ